MRVFTFSIVVSFILSTYCPAQKNEVTLGIGAISASNQQIRQTGIACVTQSCIGVALSSANTGVAISTSYSRELFTVRRAYLNAEFPFFGVPGRDLTIS